MVSPADNIIDLSTLQQWVGRELVAEDTLALAPARALSATLDHPRCALQEGDPLPLPWHWLFFLPTVPTSELGVDGHPQKGGFLPPVPLPRRMWAGGTIDVLGELRLGQRVRRSSTITDIQHKSGRSGELVFVTLRHELCVGKEVVIRERQDLVYREAPKPGSSASVSAPRKSQWSCTRVATPTLLFRYSALTFNSHRIHYDQEYAVQEEGYADLVVQGPLCATLMLEQLDRHCGAARVRQFDYSGVRPLMANTEFSIQGCMESAPGGDAIRAHVWILDVDGDVTMQAEAILEEDQEGY